MIRSRHAIGHTIELVGRTVAFVLLASSLILPSASLAGPREQAKRMHDRLVGVSPSASILTMMETLIAAGDPIAAADLAMQNPAFYTAALVNFVTPWTNEAQTVFDDLNDYTATVVGMIRDDVPFNEVLSADLVYTAAPGVVASAYSHTNNDHYIELQASGMNLGDPNVLIGVPQSSIAGSQLGPNDAAGVVTTRAAAKAFFSAGTNRRMWRFTTMNYLCRDMELLNDISRPADRIRQDVTRSPGGDSTIFHTSCVGCHSGMDPLAQAYAYFEWDDAQERLIHTPGTVQPKYLINAGSFPGGYVTADNRWDNLWRAGPNAVLDWRGPEAGGFGPQGLGREVGATHAFSECQVEKVFQNVCFRAPSDLSDRAEIDRIADVFEAQNYSMKRVFAETATYCMGN